MGCSYRKSNDLDVKFFIESILQWYEKNGRRFPWRNSSDVYKVLIAEKMLQRTQAKLVDKIYRKFIKRYPSFRLLAKADIKDIENLLKPLGLYRIRARELKAMAVYLQGKVGGRVRSIKDIEGLKGIGKYVKDAVMCFVFRKKVIPIDVNIERVFTRFFYGGGRRIEEKLLKKVVKRTGSRDIKKLVWGMLDFEDEICKPKSPKCNFCPLSEKCLFFIKSRDYGRVCF